MSEGVENVMEEKGIDIIYESRCKSFKIQDNMVNNGSAICKF
ncbi:hypothetical protein ACTNDG_09360 [Clostridium sp. HCP1S3_B4]|nr:hypothetical protein [Lachnospiraceae bacterium]